MIFQKKYNKYYDLIKNIGNAILYTLLCAVKIVEYNF